MNEEELMADHWWWRPGWHVGRRGCAWHRPSATPPRPTASPRPTGWGLKDDRRGLDPVPDTVAAPDDAARRRVTDEVAEADVRAMISAATRRLALLPAFDITLDRPVITREAVRWDVVPAEPVAAVRLAIRAGHRRGVAGARRDETTGSSRTSIDRLQQRGRAVRDGRRRAGGGRRAAGAGAVSRTPT